MTRDPQIKPCICHLYFVEGPPVVVRRYEERVGHKWSHRNGDRAVIIDKDVRQFPGCIVAHFIIDYNQPEDYEPRKWVAWCNAKHPIPTVISNSFDVGLYHDFMNIKTTRSPTEAMRRFGRCRIRHTDGFTYTIQLGPKNPILRVHETKYLIRPITSSSGATAVHIPPNNHRLSERESPRGKRIHRESKPKRTSV